MNTKALIQPLAQNNHGAISWRPITRMLGIALISCGLMACEQGLVKPDDASNKSNSAEQKSKAHINVEHRKSKQQTLADMNAQLGAGYINNGNYEKALVKLQKALKLDPNNGTAYNYLGVLYWRLEQPKLAEKNFKISQQKSPFDASISHNYASFLCEHKRYGDSMRIFDKVFKNPLYDRMGSAYQLAGNCALKMNDFTRSEKLLKQALKVDATAPQALLGMAKLFYKTNRLKLAKYYFERFDRESQHTPDSLWFGINLERKLGNQNSLSSYILTLKNLYPDSDETLMLIQEKQDY